MNTPFALEHALAYATLGWSVIPIKPDSKIPPIKWKPYQTKRPTKSQLTTWFTKWPRCNVGITTGPGSGICSLDFDTQEAVDIFRWKIGEIPDSLRFETGKGMQVLFKYPANTELNNQAGIIDNIDFRGQGGLIILPPSIHKSGKRYSWIDIDPIEMGIDDLLEIPEHIMAFLQNGQQGVNEAQIKEIPTKGDKLPPFKPQKDPGWVQEALMGVGKGRRNDTGTRLAGFYFNIFDREKTAVALVTQNLLNWNLRNTPPMAEIEIHKIVKSIGDKHGTQKLSHLIQKKIHGVQKLHYPDGDIRYNIFFDTHDNAVHLTAEELISSMKFRTRMMQITDKIIRPIKNEKYWPIIEEVLAEAVPVQMREDETKIAAIRDVIQDDIDRGQKYKTIEKFLKTNAVCKNDHIYLTLLGIADKLKFSAIKTTQKELGNLLRKMGFKPSAAFKSVRTWRISLTDFKKIDEILEEDRHER